MPALPSLLSFIQNEAEEELKEQAISTLVLLSDDPSFASAVDEAQGIGDFCVHYEQEIPDRFRCPGFHILINAMLLMGPTERRLREELVVVLLHLCQQVHTRFFF